MAGFKNCHFGVQVTAKNNPTIRIPKLGRNLKKGVLAQKCRSNLLPPFFYFFRKNGASPAKSTIFVYFKVKRRNPWTAWASFNVQNTEVTLLNGTSVIRFKKLFQDQKKGTLTSNYVSQSKYWKWYFRRFFDDDFLDMSFFMIKKLSRESGNAGIEAEIKTANVIFQKQMGLNEVWKLFE